MSLLANAASVLKSPHIAVSYVRYQWKARKQFDGFALGNFSNFSEYLNSNFLSAAETRFLTTQSFPEGDIIDVGAHIGFISILMAKRYPNRTIHAFEASPSTCRSLNGNLELNEIKNVQTHNLAITDHEGKVTFNANPGHRATNSIALESDLYKISIPCTTIDNFIEKNNLSQIALLKIDVEGHEDSVLKGAEKTLEKTQMVFYEVCPSNTQKAGTDIEIPFRILTEHGFTMLRFSGEKLIPALRSDILGLGLDNWIAVKHGIAVQASAL
ncbi:MAG: FkbM family methyltransferase [Acidobacteriota bacterium]